MDVPEISDLILRFDPATGARLDVRKADVVARFEALGRTTARDVVASIPERDGVLDAGAVDAMLRRSHAELQRLSEEFHLGHRVLELLRPTVRALRCARPGRRIRIVDVGCGLGYVVRWLAACAELGEDVDLVGCDYNEPLLASARRLADREGLRCSFVAGNAFALAEPADVYTSTAVLHHFHGQDLPRFFSHQREAFAFFHFDIEPTWAAPLGAWLFHATRMREPMARHDGVLSALRAHSREVLVNAARTATTDHRLGFHRLGSLRLPLTGNLRPIVGIHDELWSAWRIEMGRNLRRFASR